MMQPITYSLCAGDPRSDTYYRRVATFATEVVAQGETLCFKLVDDLLVFLQRPGLESPRTRPEYLYEVLTLGVLWHCYAARALRLSPLPRSFLARLAELRERNARFKSSADVLRGVLGAFFWQPDRPGAHAQPELTLENYALFLDWLAATGVFNEEVERLRTWRDCWLDLPPPVVAAHASAALAYALWFETRSLIVLGQYTPNVEQFLTEVHPRYRWRADNLFCGRRRVEYHLGMVGTEILNQAFRGAFLQATRKIVLIPPCMRFQPAEKCKARSTGFGAQCAHCTPRCHAHQVTRLGEKYGVPVFILPDELSVFSEAGSAGNAHLGIVGVSCVLTNAPGGWETRRLGVAAQGLPLDYCGCHWHWHKQGIPTNVNVSELLRLLAPPATLGGATTY